MSFRWPTPGIGHVPEFQASGHTLVITGSSTEIVKLKYVASSITVAATAQANLTIYDSSHEGLDFTVPANATARYKGKFLTLKVPDNMSALIELTNIPSGSYTPPIASNLHYV